MTNKHIVMIGAIGGMVIGACVPRLWGDYNSFGLASVLCGMTGGFLGIWLVVWFGKKLR